MQTKNYILLITFVLFTALATAAPQSTMNDLPSSTSLADGVHVEGSASGDSLDEISIRVKDPGDSFWTHLASKNCEGLPDCSISLESNYSPSSTGEKEFSVYVDDQNGNGDPSAIQTVDFTDGTLDVSMIDLPNEENIENSLTIDTSATGESLDHLTVEYREEGGDWQNLNNKSCNNSNACSLAPSYNTNTAQEVDFRAIVEEESDSKTTNIQTISFVESTTSDSVDDISLNNLPNEENLNTDLSIDASATGQDLDSITVKYREENSDWTNLRTKNCNNSNACSLDTSYTTSAAQDVDFKAVAEAGSDSSTTNTQTVSFVDGDTSQTVDDVSMNNLPSEHRTQSNLTLEASTTGTSLDGLEIKVDNGNGWETWRSKDCSNSNACSMDKNYTTSEEQNVRFKVRAYAGETGQTTNSQTVSFYNADNEYVDDVSMNNLPNQQLKGENMEIEASTTGRNLDRLVIKERINSGWETLREKNCQGERACSIDITDYQRDTEGEVDFKAIAEAGSDERNTNMQTVDFVNEYNLEADFTFSPSNPDEGENVDFESTSTGDINSWSWDFDDGDTAQGETVTHSFNEEGDYLVELVVDDGENTAKETKLVSVGEQAGACDINVGDMKVEPGKIPVGDNSKVSVPVENQGQKQDLTVTFRVGGEDYAVEEYTLNSGETKQFSINLSPKDDVGLHTIIETDGSGSNSCSYYRWDRTDYLTVYQTGTNDATFNFDVEDTNGDELDNVRVRGENGEIFTRYTDENGEASANIDSGTYDITASKPGYNSVTKTRTVDTGETETVSFNLERTEGGDNLGELSVLAQNTDEQPLQNVEITAENGDNEIEDTDENGRAFFYLEEGEYTVTAEKQGYHTQTRDIEIEAGERTPIMFEMTDRDEDSVRITNLEYDDTVCRGDTLEVTASVANSRDSDELVNFRGEGLGTSSDRHVVTERGNTIERVIRFTNVQGSGSEEFEVSIDNSVHDSEIGEVEVDSCGFQDSTGDATGLTAELIPKRVQIGETVRIKGFVDGLRGAGEVEISSNGNTIARTSTDRSGYYSTYTRFNTPGTKNIEINSGGLTRSRNVEVLATATVGGIISPQQVFESEEFEICADVSSQVDADVVLLRNGEVLNSKNGNGRVCFTTKAGSPGTAIYEIRALTSGSGGSSTKTIEVLEQGNEVETFPDQLASVESGGSIAKVELYNTNDDMRTYNLDLTGIEELWYSQSDETVHLSSGERETVYFYLTPRAEGVYRPTLRVESEGTAIYDSTIILEAEGTDEPQKLSLIQKIIRFFKW